MQTQSRTHIPDTEAAFEGVYRFLIQQVQDTGLPVIMDRDGVNVEVGSEELENYLNEWLSERPAREEAKRLRDAG